MVARRRYGFVVAVLAFLFGCGSDVEHAASSGTGAGGAGGVGGAGGGGGAAGAGGESACGGALEVKPPTIAVTALFQSSPRIALGASAGHVLYSFLNASPPEAGSLYAMDVEAFGAWPPPWSPAQLVDEDVQAYALGPGPSGPLGLLFHGSKAPSLADALLPMLNVVDVPITGSGSPLFVTGIPDRYFWADSHDTGAYHVLHVGSYQPGSLPQSEQPATCTTTPHWGQAVAMGDGFLAALVEPNLPEPACDPMAPKAGTAVSFSRYVAPPEAGTFLQRSQGDRLPMGEPLVGLGLAQASFGAWVVFQTDGSTSLVPPPIVASRVDMDGHTLVPNGDMISVTQGGFLAPALSVASLGDTLAVAYVDPTDPVAPHIRVQLVRADGSLGEKAEIPTNESWNGGALQIVASPAQNSLFLAWASAGKGGVTSFARVDCLP